MKNKLFIKFFSSGLQAISVQIFGVIFFYYISLYLTKQDFGIISWANAVCVFITTILSCGMEQVIVRRIAASKTSDWSAAAYLFHSFVGSALTFIVLWGISFFVNSRYEAFHFLPWFFIAQGLMYMATPLKQFLNAKERFAPYGIIALVSNISKIILGYILIREGDFAIKQVITIVVICALFELTALFVYIITHPVFRFRLRFRYNAYIKLIKESLTPYMSVIFDSSLSRMDWILLGILSTNVVTADYSFAYRAYEIARMPVVIIAPLIFPRFARYLNLNNNKPGDDKKQQINNFFTIEMFVAMSLPLCLNIIWAPWVSTLTQGKYGASNATEFFLLSLCIPFQFLINLLWTLSFAGRKYRKVTNITILSAVVNIMLNLVVIPLYGGFGAACAFLITNIVQASLYYIMVKKEFMLLSLRSFFALAAIAICSYFTGMYIGSQVAVHLFAAIVIYVILSVLLKQVKGEHWATLKLYMTK